MLHHELQLRCRFRVGDEPRVRQLAVLFWLGFIVVGLVAPTAVETWLLFISKPGFEETPKAHYIGAAADAGVLIGGFLLRFLIVVAALPVALV